MNILIIEDEIITATDLKNTLQKKGHTVLSICKTYDEVLTTLSRSQPDLLLVDIKLRLSRMDGVQIAEEITRNFPIPLIFLTSQTDLDTFNRAKHLQPAAYLFKPFRQAELAFQVELAYEHYLINRPSSPHPSTSESVFFPYKGGHQKVNKKEVQFIKADGTYVKMYIKNEKTPLLFSMNLGYLCQFFPGITFYKLSRSALINLDHVLKIVGEQVYFEGSDETLSIPQAQKTEFMKQFALIKTPKKA